MRTQCAAVNPMSQKRFLYLSKLETYIKIMGEGVEGTQFYFSSTNFKIKLFDEARRHGVDLGKNSLKRPTKLISELKITPSIRIRK